MTVDKNKIKPIYGELKGYLSQSPIPKDVNDPIDDPSVWRLYNSAIDILSTQTGNDYGRFKVVEQSDGSYRYITLVGYRHNLGGIISRLHAEYFSDEPPPFSGTPSAIISQIQNQSVLVEMRNEIQSKIDQNLNRADIGEKEKGFLQKFKSILGSITNVNDLLRQCLKLAKDAGLTMQDILGLWG